MSTRHVMRNSQAYTAFHRLFLLSILLLAPPPLLPPPVGPNIHPHFLRSRTPSASLSNMCRTRERLVPRACRSISTLRRPRQKRKDTFILSPFAFRVPVPVLRRPTIHPTGPSRDFPSPSQSLLDPSQSPTPGIAESAGYRYR